MFFQGSFVFCLTGSLGCGTTETGPDPTGGVASVSVTSPTQSLASIGQTIQLQAAALDASGGAVAGVQFNWASPNTSVVIVNQSGVATAVSDGSVSVTATTGGIIGSISLLVQQVAATMTLTLQPGDAASGSPFSSQPVLEIRDANGNRVAGDNQTTVTSSVASGTASLSGSTSATASGGVVTFADLTLTGPVGNHTLSFSGGGFSSTSDGFDLAPGPASPSNSVVTVSSDTVQSGTSSTATLQVRDASDNNQVSGGLAVTFFATGGSATGTFGAITDAGDGSYSAAFTGDLAGTATEIGAVIGGDTVTTPRPTVTVVSGTASQLVFVVQPTSVQAGAVVAPAVEVNAVDASGNLSDSFAGNVTLAIDNNAGGGIPGGTLTRSATSGVVLFDDLTIDKSGSGYTLRVVAAGLTDGISGGFNVSSGAAVALQFSVQPTDVDSSITISPGVTVVAVDVFGNTDATFVERVDVVVAEGPGGATLNGTSSVVAVVGEAVFTNLQLDVPSAGYKLTSSSISLIGDTSAAFVVMPTGTTLYWTGATSTDWDESGNWSADAVPTAADNLFVPAGPSKQPLLSKDAVIANLYVEDGAQLGTNGFEIVAGGNVRAGNTITGTGLVTLTGSGKTISGTLPNVLINGTVQAEGLTSVSGNLTVTGTFTLAGQLVTVGGDFNTTGSGFLIMTDVADTLDVVGAVTFAGATTAGWLAEGLIRVGGNFDQNSGISPLSFAATGSNTVVFTGTVAQSVAIEAPGNAMSRFANVEFVNPAGVNFTTDVTVTGTATITSGVITGTIVVTLVEGNLVGSTSGGWQVDTTMITASSVSLPDNISVPLLIFPNSAPGTVLTKGFQQVGDLLLTGHLDLGGNRVVVSGDFATSGANGRLAMLALQDTLRVDGNATFDGMVLSGFLNNGVLEITGNFIQNSSNATSAYQSTDMHKVVFNGSGTQTITFASPGGGGAESFFGNLEIATADSVVFATSAVVRTLVTMTSGRATGTVAVVELQGNMGDAAGGLWQLDSTMITGGAVSLPDSMNAPLLIFSTGTNLSKGFKQVGDMVLTGQLNINGNRVVVVGDFSTSGATGRLGMEVQADTLRVEGNVTFDGIALQGFLHEGVLEVTGDFTQSSTLATQSFQSVLGHKVVFNGSGTQTIAFASPGGGSVDSFFGTLEIATADSVVFATPATVKTLITMTSGRATGTVAAVELQGSMADATGGLWQVDTTMITASSVSLPDSMNAPLLVFSTGTNLSKGFKQVGDVALTGQLNINGNRVVVVGDFSTSGATGRLGMEVQADTLRVEGNVTFDGIALQGFLHEGVLEVTGDFTQSSTLATQSFQSVLGHKVVFNGSGTQTITFASPGGGSVDSFFDTVEIINANGVILASNVTVKDDFDLIGQLTVAGGTILNIADVLFLRNTSTLNNDGTITKGSCVVEVGAVINGTNPCP